MSEVESLSPELATMLGASFMSVEPPEGYVYAICPSCYDVTMALREPDEPLPWCVHSNHLFLWRDPTPATQAGDRPWTRMVQAEVDFK